MTADNKPAERRQFTDEFKRETVRLAKERGNLAQVARELGISDTVLQRRCCSAGKRRCEKHPATRFPDRATPKTRKRPRSGAKTPACVRRWRF